MPKKIAVVGATGYAGGEIVRLLLTHPAVREGELELAVLTGNSRAGAAVESVLPHLVLDLARVGGPTTVVETSVANLSHCEIVFFALPHGHSGRWAKQLPDSTVIIDCAADFRLKNEKEWQQYYDAPYAGHWPYGLPELPGNREEVTGATRVAVPGCFPTGASLALYPALAAGIAEPEISLTAITGVSGAGKKPTEISLAAQTIGNLRTYKHAGTHRHIPEIMQNLAPACIDAGIATEKLSLSFTPVLAPTTRGILAIAHLPLTSGQDLDTEKAHHIYQKFYYESACVFVTSSLPETKNVQGSNAVHINVEVDERARRLVVVSAIDNLTKGTAGGAIQCMNLILGFAEMDGLPLSALCP